MTSNVAKVMEAAVGTASWGEGLRWYSDARDLCSSWCPRDVDYACAVMAALSPRCSWERNVEMTARHLCGRPVKTLGVTMRKLGRLRGENHPFPSLTGRKVRAFYDSIRSGGEGREVCVDRHAYAVYVGRPVSEKESAVLQKKGTYDTVSETYREVAREFGVAPPQCQAITWVWWRDQKRTGAGRKAVRR